MPLHGGLYTCYQLATIPRKLTPLATLCPNRRVLSSLQGSYHLDAASTVSRSIEVAPDVRERCHPAYDMKKLFTTKAIDEAELLNDITESMRRRLY